jgi:hypothetical protein
MTPKEKANELVDKFYQRFPLTMDVITTRGDLSWEYDSWNEAKQCALIAVDEIIEAGKDVDEFANAYWYKVKAEIDNL